MSNNSWQNQTTPHMAVPKKKKSSNRLAWILGVAAVITLIALVLYPLWLPRLVRTFIPDRYIVAYAPEFVQEMVFNSGENRALPTLSPLEANADEAFFDDLSTLVQTPENSIGGEVKATETPVIPPTSIPDRMLPAEVLLTGFDYDAQGWNNCGPTNFAMQLSFWDLPDDQYDIADAVKPDPEDSNVRPDELAAYGESIGMDVTVRLNGDIETLKAFIAANIPVVIERGFDELPELDWMGHYMLLVGYNDDPGVFYALDSYWGHHRAHDNPDFPLDTWGYDRLDDLWRHFNRTYIVVYTPDRADEVASIIGAQISDEVMLSGAFQQAQADIGEFDDTFSWYNLGSTLTQMGDYEKAADAFDIARARDLPWRMTWYHFDIYEAYYQVGRYDEVLAMALSTVDITNYPESEEGHYFVGLCRLAEGNVDAAEGAFSRALRYNPTYEPAALALASLD